MHVGHLHAAILADEDVLRTHIAYLLALAVEGLASGEQDVQQVPELVLLEELGVEAFSIIDLV